MNKTIKNRPATTEEILNEQITPYIESEIKPVVDNDNRGNDISVKDDIFKNIAIGFKDIDDAILYYFRNVIKASVIEDDNRINVPIIYSDPERWKAAQADGYFRDKDGKVLYPIIAIKMDSIEKRRDLGNKLDGNRVHLYQSYHKKYSAKNRYDNFSALTNRIPVREIQTIIVPDYHTITYSCAIYVNYREDLNDILESITYSSDSYWGDKERFQFMASIDSIPITQQVSQGEDRIISSEFTIKMNGHIIPKSVNKELSSKSKYLSKAQIIFNSELGSIPISNRKTNPVENYNPYVNKVNVNNANKLSVDLVLYLECSLEVKANGSDIFSDYFILRNVSIKKAPDPLPTTSKKDFDVFRNGQYINKDYIVSIEKFENAVKVILDVNALGQSLESDDILIVKGKFDNA